MPKGDGTGPAGLGRMSGRAAGYCAGLGTPGYTPSTGSGFGAGRGLGFSRKFFRNGGPGRAQFINGAGMRGACVSEKEILANQASFLEKQLEMVKGRLSQLDHDD
jgi:hypothetical protein